MITGAYIGFLSMSMNVVLPIRFQRWIYPFINGILPDCLNCCSHPGLIPALLQSGTQASLSLLCPALTDSLVPGWPPLHAGSDFSFLPSLLQVLPGCNCGNKYVIIPECLCRWDILKRWDGDDMFSTHWIPQDLLPSCGWHLNTQ